jgi:hypothetical protein
MPVEEGSRPAGGPQVEIRLCLSSDREGLQRLGHPPGVVDILCPPLGRRIAWRLRGTLSRTALAIDGRTRSVLGSVQFLRSRRDRATWMFGHWRIAAGRRREGIGRRLLREGSACLPAGARLYSYVDAGNEPSIAAHERCGFEAGRTLQGSAPLSVLTTIGPATPALRLEPAGFGDSSVVFGLYARAMGSLWFRLFPRLRPGRFLPRRFAGFRVVLLAKTRDAEPGGGRQGDGRGGSGPAGIVVWEGESLMLYVDPAACDAAFVARVALQLTALGARRESTLEIRGLPRTFLLRPGPIHMQVLMGMPDPWTQWKE